MTKRGITLLELMIAIIAGASLLILLMRGTREFITTASQLLTAQQQALDCAQALICLQHDGKKSSLYEIGRGYCILSTCGTHIGWYLKKGTLMRYEGVYHPSGRWTSRSVSVLARGITRFLVRYDKQHLVCQIATKKLVLDASLIIRNRI